mgnify:CR=1 FL=1
MRYRIVLLLGILLLLLVVATPVLSQQQNVIEITGAAARFDTPATRSTELDTTFGGVRDRIIVQAAAALQRTVVQPLPADLRTVLERVAPRIIVQSAQASTSYELRAPGPPVDRPTPTPTDESGATPTPTDESGATPTPTDESGATPTPTDESGATPTPTPIATDALVVNVETGAPGSVFIFTAPNLPAGARVQVAVQRPGGSAFSTLLTLNVPDGGTLVFVLVTTDDDPAGTYTVRIRTEPSQRGLAQVIERTRNFTLDAAESLRTEQPTDAPMVPLKITQRVYLPLIVRGR